MKKTIILKELRDKDTKSLFSELAGSRRKLSELRFKASFRKIKNYKEISFEKRKIAWIWTILSEKALQELKDKEAKNVG